MSRRPLGPWLGALAILGGLLIVLAAVLYVERGRVAAGWAETWFRSRGIEARIEFDTLSLSGLTGRLAIGPAAHPDLTIDRLEADFARPGGGMPKQIKALRIGGLRLNASFDGKAVSFGRLQPLIDQILAQKGPRPPMDVTVTDSLVIVTTPAGRARIHLSGAAIQSQLTRLDAHADPTRLIRGGVRASVRNASLSVRAAKAGLSGVLTADVSEAGGGSWRMGGTRIQVSGLAPTITPAGWSGPLTLEGSVDADGVRAGSLIAKTAHAAFGLNGFVSGSLKAPAFAGRARGRLASDRATAGAGEIRGLVLDLSSPDLAMDLDPAKAGAIGQSHLAATAAALDFGQGRSAAHLTGLVLRADGPTRYAGGRLAGRWAASGEAEGRIASAPAGWREARLAAAKVTVSASPAGTVVVTADAPIRAEAKGGGVIDLAAFGARPLTQTTAQGARGALVLTLKGPGFPAVRVSVPDYAIGSAGLVADLTAKARLDNATIQGLEVSAPGRLTVGRSESRFQLIACAPVALARLRGAKVDVVTHASVRLCPAPGPASTLRIAQSRWSLRATARDGQATIPGAQAAIAGLEAGLDFTGDGRGLGVDVAITGARLHDAAPEARFADLTSTGALHFASKVLTGRLAVAGGPHGAALGTVALSHDTRSGAGSAEIAVPRLVFDSKGLQPGDLAAAAGALVQRASGAASFAGRFAWTRDGLTSNGRLVVGPLDFKSALGHATGLRADLTLTSLAPLVSAPDQVLTVQRIEAATPLTDLTARYALTADGVAIGALGVKISGGTASLDPMTVAWSAPGEAHGVLRLAGIDLGALVAASSLADSVAVQARVSGEIPFTLGSKGPRIAGGRIAAVGPGRLSIKRQALAGGVAAASPARSPGAPAATANLAQDFAYQALENLAFDKLEADVASRPEGRLGVIFQIRGRHDPPTATRAFISLRDILRRRLPDRPIPLPKGTVVNLTLDTSINLDDLIAAYIDSGAGRPRRSPPVQPRAR